MQKFLNLYYNNKKIFQISFTIFLFLLIVYIINNAIAISTTVYTGVIQKITPVPFYGYMRIPENTPFDAGNKFGADHIIYYLMAKKFDLTGSLYGGLPLENPDPWSRAPTVTPLSILISFYIGKFFNFPLENLIHIYIQITIFLISIIYFFKNQKKSNFLIFLSITITLLIIFCTKIGLTWFERSQDDLFVATSFLLYFKGMRDKKYLDFILAGFLISLKWSGLPFFACLIIFYLINNFEIKKIFEKSYIKTIIKTNKKQIIGLCIIIASPFVSLFIFGEDANIYLKIIKSFESGNIGDNSILAYLKSKKTLLKMIVILFVYFIYFQFFKNKNETYKTNFIQLIVISILALITSKYGTNSYVYRYVSCLFLIPYFIDNIQNLYEVNNKKKFSKYKYLIFGFFIILLTFSVAFHFIETPN